MSSDEDVEVPVMKVLGSRIIPRSLVDTAHLSILNHCAEEDGAVTSITLRLGATPPGDGTDWEARIYDKSGPREFVLISRARLHINIRSLVEQEIVLSKALPIKKGQYVGLTNRSGRLSVTYTRGWAADTTTNRDFWDLWYQEIQPSAELNSKSSAMLLWNGRVGWYASMREDPPEPMVEKVKSTMGFDIGQLWHDKEMTDVVFEVGVEKTGIRAHKIILKARSRYFAALLAGGFAEGVTKAKHIVINDTSPEAFTKVLEWLYTDEITDVHAGIAAEVLQAGSKYCLDGLVAASEIVLKEYVTAESVGEIYQLATDTNANAAETQHPSKRPALAPPLGAHLLQHDYCGRRAGARHRRGQSASAAGDLHFTTRRAARRDPVQAARTLRPRAARPAEHRGAQSHHRALGGRGLRRRGGSALAARRGPCRRRLAARKLGRIRRRRNQLARPVARGAGSDGGAGKV